jgi:hypothetical protein
MIIYHKIFEAITMKETTLNMEKYGFSLEMAMLGKSTLGWTKKGTCELLNSINSTKIMSKRTS